MSPYRFFIVFNDTTFIPFSENETSHVNTHFQFYFHFHNLSWQYGVTYISEVALRPAGLVLGLVTVRCCVDSFFNHLKIGLLSLAIPLGRRSEYYDALGTVSVVSEH